MKQFAILGYPLGHTLSPQLHRLLARELGEQIDYQICQIAPEQLEQRLPELFALDGFNITIPYKELGDIAAVLPDGTRRYVIRNGRFAVAGAEALNEPLEADR